MNASAQEAWPIGDSETASHIRRFDWSGTPLGPISGWPQSLRTIIEVALESPQPRFVAFGPDLQLLYNDAFSPILGDRHPHIMGKPMREAFAELWSELSSAVEDVMNGKPQLFIDRHFTLPWRTSQPDSWFTYSWTPLRDEGGVVSGFIVSSFETTARVLAQRKLRESEERHAFLLRLNDALRPLANPEHIQIEAARVLGEYLDADRVGYAEDQAGSGEVVVTGNYVNGVRSLEGRYRYEDYGSDLMKLFNAGRTFISDDIANDPSLSEAERKAHADLQVGASANVPLMRGGNLRAILFLHYRNAHAFSEKELALLREVAERTWAEVMRARAEAALRESEERLRMALAAGRLGTWRYVIATDENSLGPGMCKLLGIAEDTGPMPLERFFSTVHPDDRERTRTACLHALREGGELDLEFRICRPRGLVIWLKCRGQVFTDASGKPVVYSGAAMDITELKGFEERQAVLVAELQHRTRNLIGLVGAMASHSMSASPSMEEFHHRFQERLRALSRIQGILSQVDRRVTIGALVRLELDALASDEQRDCITLEGPEITLPRSVVQTVSMALHELATNAAKYGALSSDRGRLSIKWRETAETGGKRLFFSWVEEGLDLKQGLDDVRGFGRQLIEEALPYSHDAKTSFEIRQSGVRCTIDLPLEKSGGGRAR